ncbi:MAG TPA: sigma 54-interacting transcriptional regulator [Acetobacteraceae bacterium]|nr:sigma 54-interacting transcriptional regulator [Acetobacteraceae bacterium]
MSDASSPLSDPTPIGESPAFLDMLAHVSQVAPLNRPLLLCGERGVGKEVIANRLVYLSNRWDKPFLKLNCAALAESLLDSELFGHEAGAFTGATRRRASRFEMADGGTLFLDEIANASLAVQEKILRVIEYGSFERVGGNAEHHVDVRILAATNADLPALAAAGKFRPDLLDRLAFDVILIPPLRERPSDIFLLARHFATRMTSELGRAYFPGFTDTVLQRLAAAPWPGNVRELRNVVERSVYRMARLDRPLETLFFNPFGSAPETAPTGVSGAGPRDFRARVRAYEAALLEKALAEEKFNQRRAARALGLSYHQFRYHLRTHGLLGPERSDARRRSGQGGVA